MRESVALPLRCAAAKRALGKQRKRWAATGLLDQPFNPVTLSLRQTACYRSFHYVSEQQIALKVRRTGRAVTAGQKKKKNPRVQRSSSRRVITLLQSDVQISGDSGGNGDASVDNRR